MRRFSTLICLLCLAIPAGMSVSGCSRNPAANYCNGEGYGAKITDVAKITLSPQTTGISLAFGQTQQLATPVATTCKSTTATVSSYTYGTTNNQLVDVSTAGNLCAGTWNRNTGGGIADYTTCTAPSPLPSTNGLPYKTAYVTATADSVTSNPVSVYVHSQITTVTLVGSSQCYSQGSTAQLDVQACYSGKNSSNVTANVLLCAPSSVTSASSPSLACDLPYGISLSSIPTCTSSIGMLTYTVGTSSVATINSETNMITADLPGTTAITASVAGSGASAGHFSTCPPKSISLTLNGKTSGTVTKGDTQNLVTTVLDTTGSTITGLSLDYQSTDPLDISASSAGAITASYPSQASVYAICQPTTCNPAPTDQVGIYGTGLSISSNPVSITVPGTASDYLWFAAPGQSQYFVPVKLLSGTVGSVTKLPYVPNSMVMDRLGNSLYFGSTQELMVYSTSTNALTKENANVKGVVLAVSPDNSQLLINDQQLGFFYLYNVTAATYTSQGGMGNAAAWTPDAKTLYITDSATLGGNHSDMLYVYNVNTGWTSHSLSSSASSKGAQSLALAIPSVGAFLSGNPTVAHTWCPSGTVGDSLLYYPLGTVAGSVDALTDVLAATVDGGHILGASTTGTSTSGANITLSDIGVTIPQYNCLPTDMTTNPLATGDLLSPLVLTTTLNQTSVTAAAAAVNQVVTSPASNLAFLTYTPITSSPSTGVSLPYYVPGSSGTLGTVGSITLTDNSEITAPIAGAFSPDDTYFFVSTAGDNKIHYISVSAVSSDPTNADTQQISPALPACSSTETGCTYTGNKSVVPATVIVVKPRVTT